MNQKQLAAVYDPTKDVVLFYVPRALPAFAMAHARAFVAETNEKRARVLPPGDRKDIAEKTAKACRAGRFQQVIATKGEVELFQATTGTGKIISIGGSK